LAENAFLKWLASETKSNWWNDSGNPDEINAAIANGATGVTLNPLLLGRTLFDRSDYWNPKLKGIPGSVKDSQRAEEIARIITCEAASIVRPIYEKTKGNLGYVCAQVDPGKAFDSEYMFNMAKRLNSWAPNIAVKLPVTKAALDTLEECAAIGITVVMTVGFSVAQSIAVAERYEKGIKRAEKNGVAKGKCFSVIMIGRLDDYLIEAAVDNGSKALKEDVVKAGVAVTKRTYGIYREKGYKPILLPSGLRLGNQAAQLAGGDLLFSISPGIQKQLQAFGEPFTEQIDAPVEKDVIDRLMTIRDFARAYEPDGLSEDEFIGFAPTQRTLTQFLEAGWNLLKTYEI
jgi:transaldolase